MSKSTELIDACRQGDLTKMKALVQDDGAAGVDVNTVVNWPSGGTATPLVVCAMFLADTSCARLLIGAKADVDFVCEPDHETALHMYCSRGLAEGVSLLIDDGAQLGLVDKLGRSPLLLCCLSGHGACAELMLRAGADTEQAMTTHNPGATPLYAAALTGSARCVSLLCDARANVNASCRDGATPMLVSCQEGHSEVAMLLSSYGASRGRWVWGAGCAPYEEANVATSLAARFGHTGLAAWLRTSSIFADSPLHHVEILTRERVLELLRSGKHSPTAPAACNPRTCTTRHEPASSCEGENHDGTACAICRPAAVDRAREYLHACSDSASRGDEDAPRRDDHGVAAQAAARMIMKAAQPWSPSTHTLWGEPQRALAVALLHIGYQLRDKHCEGALLDLWVDQIMPRVVTWSSGQTREGERAQ